MSKRITFHSPKTIHFGSDSLTAIADEAKRLGSRALIITDEVMTKVGHVEKCKRLLSEVNVTTVTYEGVNSEPNDTYVYEAVDLYKLEKCEFIISLGGGSCIDTAKAVASLVPNEKKVEDLYKGIQHKPVPHIAIPTTAGTGSEATDVTVITHSREKVKMMIKNPLFVPEIAIVDPKLTLSCPPSVVAGTGVDAFCHAVEAFISKKSHQLTDTLALSAMELIINHIHSAYHNESDLKAREAMSLASLQAGLAFSNASVCLIHGMSRPVGALFNVPHGISNAMLLPAVLKFSVDGALDRLSILGRMFDLEKQLDDKVGLAHIAVEQVEKLTRDLNIPNLKEWGIKEEDFLFYLDKMTEDAIASGSPANNPIVPTQEEIKSLYLESYNY